MAQPAELAERFEAELEDPSRPVGEFRLRQIIADCRTALRKMAPGPEAARLLGVLGTALGRSEKYEEAARAFRAASLLEPREWRHLNNEGVMLIGLERPDDAIERLQRALSMLAAPQAILHANIAWAHWVAGRRDAANASLQAARRSRDLGDEMAHYAIAGVAERMGEREIMIDAFARFVALRVGAPSPGDPLAFLREYEDRWRDRVLVSPSLVVAVDGAVHGLPDELSQLPEEDEILDDDELAAIARWTSTPPTQRSVVTADELRRRTEERD